jgi:hypothetical protein
VPPAVEYYNQATDWQPVAWSSWNTTTTAASTTTSLVWSNWTTIGTTSASYYTPAREPPAEELVQARRDELAAAAREAAEATLRLLLDDDQWSAWEADKRFVVTTPAGRRYLIRRGVSGNVRLLNDADREVESLCAHPDRVGEDGMLPVEDVVIAQVLALRADEQGFRQIANITRHPGAIAA